MAGEQKGRGEVTEHNDNDPVRWTPVEIGISELAYRMGRQDGVRSTLRRVANTLGPAFEAQVRAVIDPDDPPAAGIWHPAVVLAVKHSLGMIGDEDMPVQRPDGEVGR